MTEDVLGYQVTTSPLARLVEEIAAWSTTGDSPKALACLNPHSWAVSQKDPAFATALHNSAWLIPDGVGVVLASRALGGAIADRITGFDVFQGVNGALNKAQGRIFLLGASEATLGQMRQRIATDWPDLVVAGTYSPPYKPAFDDDDNRRMIAAVNAAQPDVLWVGMTAPKQEIWVDRNIQRLDIRFAAGIGAVFDFYVGSVTRSHPIFNRLGLEWLPRLLREPRRLWRRTFVSAPIFLKQLLRVKMRRILRAKDQLWVNLR